MMISIYFFYAAMRVVMLLDKYNDNPFHTYIKQLEREGLAFKHFMILEDTK